MQVRADSSVILCTKSILVQKGRGSINHKVRQERNVTMFVAIEF